MAKKIYYETEAREKVLSGAKQLYDAVKVTFGPKGKNVIIEKEYGEYPIIKVIQKHEWNIVSKNTDIINDRMSELRDFNSSELWGIIKTLVAYEQKLIDKIIEDNTHK